MIADDNESPAAFCNSLTYLFRRFNGRAERICDNNGLYPVGKPVYVGKYPRSDRCACSSGGIKHIRNAFPRAVGGLLCPCVAVVVHHERDLLAPRSVNIRGNILPADAGEIGNDRLHSGGIMPCCHKRKILPRIPADKVIGKCTSVHKSRSAGHIIRGLSGVVPVPYERMENRKTVVFVYYQLSVSIHAFRRRNKRIISVHRVAVVQPRYPADIVDIIAVQIFLKPHMTGS